MAKDRGLDISQQLSKRSCSVTGAGTDNSRSRIDSVSYLDSMLDDAR